MENLLTFNLQLFADGDSADSVDNSVVVENNDIPADDSQASSDSSALNEFDFALDEFGNLVFGEDVDPAGEDPVDPTDPVDPVDPAVSYYTPEEINASPLESLDPSRISPEFLPYYNKFVNHQTELQNQIDALNKPKEELPPPPTEEKATQTQREYYEQVFNIAKAKVEANLAENFDEFNPLHITALSDEVASIKAYVIQTQNQQNQVTNLVSQYSRDPEWNNIQTFAKHSLDNMPYTQSATIRQKLDSGDIAFLGEFLKVAKEEYYKTKTPVPPVKPALNIQTKPVIKPPVVESAGTGTSTPTTQTFNYKALGKMTNDQLAEAFVQLGLTKI